MTDETRRDDEARHLLPDLVAGRLAEDEEADVRAVVDGDATLAAEVEILEALLEARPEPPADLHARIVEAVRRDRAEAEGPAAGRDLRPAGVRRKGAGSSRFGAGLPRWALAAAAVAIVALGTLELAERGAPPTSAVTPLDQVTLEDAPDPWSGDEAVYAGAPVLDGLSDEALSSLLEEIGG